MEGAFDFICHHRTRYSFLIFGDLFVKCRNFLAQNYLHSKGKDLQDFSILELAFL